MKNEYFRRIDTKLLHPKFVEKLKEMIENCETLGEEYWCTSGLRTVAEQEALYAIGRTTELTRKPVTNARAWQSMHNFGLAADFARDADHSREGLQPDWDVTKYECLADESVRLGLSAGLRWKGFRDPPHIEVDLAAMGLKLSDLQAAQKKGGIKAVWTLIDSKWVG